MGCRFPGRASFVPIPGPGRVDPSIIRHRRKPVTLVAWARVAITPWLGGCLRGCAQRSMLVPAQGGSGTGDETAALVRLSNAPRVAAIPTLGDDDELPHEAQGRRGERDQESPNHEINHRPLP